MNLKQRARLKLAKMLNIKFEEVKTETAELLIDGEVQIGAEVFMYDEEGELTIPTDGEYKYEDKVLVIEGGIITEIKEESKEDEEDEEVKEEGEIKTEMEEEPKEDEMSVRVEALEEQVKTLVDIIKEITGAVDEVKEDVEEVAEDVEAIDSEFKKVAGKSVKQPINKKTIKQSKESTLTDRFFGGK